MDRGPKDNFKSAEILSGGKAFDATQYSFFGEPVGNEDDLGGLEGALEDGLEVPPEEAGLEDAGFFEDRKLGDVDDDLSVTAMLLHQTRLKEQEAGLVMELGRGSEFLFAGPPMASLAGPSSLAALVPPRQQHSVPQQRAPVLQQHAPVPQQHAPVPQQHAPVQQQDTPQHRKVMTAADLEAQMFSMVQPQQSSPLDHLRMGLPPPGQQPLASARTDSGGLGMPIVDGPFQFSMPSLHDEQLRTAPLVLPPHQPQMPYIGVPPPGMAVLPPPLGFPMGMPPGPPGLPHHYDHSRPQQQGPYLGSSLPPGTPPPPPPAQYGQHLGMMPQPPYRQHPPQQPGFAPQQQHGMLTPPPRGPPPGMMMSMPSSAGPHHQQAGPPPGQPSPLAHQGQFQSSGDSGPGAVRGAWGQGPQRPQVPFFNQLQQPQLHPVPGYPAGLPIQQQGGQNRDPNQNMNNSSNNNYNNPRQPGSGNVRNRHGKFMSADEVDYIMHIMYAAVNNGHPYSEDYYFQAFVNSHCMGRNDAFFEPECLRDLAEGVARLDPSASVKFVPGLEGLGKLAYANLRTPRVLLDVGAPAVAALSVEGSSLSAEVKDLPHRPLNQEPLLAARIMIEDCLNLLLDVDDIDRMFKSALARKAGGQGRASQPPQSASSIMPEGGADLLRRRALLLAGITSAFRLPAAPTLTQELQSGDGVFQRVMVLAKGRTLLARALRVLVAPSGEGVTPVPGHDPIQLLWAALRNASRLFGPSPSGLDSNADRALVESSSQVAAGVVQAVSELRGSTEVASCLEALLAGLQMGPAPAVLPLAKVLRVTQGSQQQQQQPWLGEIVTRLVQKGEEVGLRGEARWQTALAKLVASVASHLEALKKVHAAAAAANNAEAVVVVMALIARPAVQAVGEQASAEERAQLRNLVLSFTA